MIKISWMGLISVNIEGKNKEEVEKAKKHILSVIDEGRIINKYDGEYRVFYFNALLFCYSWHIWEEDLKELKEEVLKKYDINKLNFFVYYCEEPSIEV